jgi:hypothetical protein
MHLEPYGTDPGMAALAEALEYSFVRQRPVLFFISTVSIRMTNFEQERGSWMKLGATRGRGQCLVEAALDEDERTKERVRTRTNKQEVVVSCCRVWLVECYLQEGA